MNFQKKHFNLQRCGFNLKEPIINSNQPTLSTSLFMPNNRLYSNDKKIYKSWLKGYVIQILRLIVVFNYFFPNGNFRMYFDYYMLKHFESLKNEELNFLKILSDDDNNYLHEYYEFETRNTDNVKELLKGFYSYLVENKNTQFNNERDRFIWFFQTASQSYFNKSKKFEIGEKSGEIYIYKFNGNFVEKINGNQGHITDGYMGQVIRTLPLIQKNYNYKGKVINRPKLVINRDAHITSIATLDAEWIEKFRDVSLTKKGKYVFNPSGPNYKGNWHDFKKCFNNDKSYYTRTGLPQGLFSLSNYTNDESILSLDEWRKSYGMAYLLDNKENIVLIKHIPYGGDNKRKDYRYGLDEYLAGQLFEIESILKRTIFLNYRPDPYVYASSNFNKTKEDFNIHWKYLTNPEISSLYFIIIILLKLKLVRDKFITSFDLMKKIELLRKDKKYTKTLTKYQINLLRQALAILPNKYKSWRTLYNLDSPRHNFKNDWYKPINIIRQYDNLKRAENMRINFLDKIKNETFELPCSDSLRWDPFYYCKVEGKSNKINTPCPTSDFTSGFYYENPPNIEVGILRSPYDLIHVANSMEKNKLKIKFNKSLYKNNKEHIRLLTALSKLNTVDMNNGKINIIPKITSSAVWTRWIKNEFGNDDNLINPLIWKALNYSEYDIPVQWFDTTNILKTNEENLKFNTYVKNLSKTKNWAKSTMEKILNNSNLNHNDYKMEVWKRKYLKYKKKYLLLKSQTL